MSKITIIGAGISGITVARLIHKRHEVQILEKSSRVGGLVKCERVEGVLFHMVGGHVFNAKNKAVFDWFWSHFDMDQEFIKARRNAKILLQNKIIGYPIENFLSEFDEQTVTKIVQELLETQKDKRVQDFDFTNFEDFLKSNFGNTLYELYFKPYNKKIWRTDLSGVPLGWLDGKLPMPKLSEIILSNILKKDEDTMVHSHFYYPKNGGSQFIADRLSEGLDVKANYVVSSIRKTQNGFLINDSIETDKIVYTGDIRKLKDIFQSDSDELQNAMHSVADLKSNGTSNLLCECDDTNLSWLYIPEDFTRAHRIIYTGNFSSTNNSGTKKTCVVEFSGMVEIEEMKGEIAKLPGNLKPLKHNYEPNSYVIQETNTREQINHLRVLLEPQGFHLLGRFAEWEYYNMDKAIEQAMALEHVL